MNEPRRPRGSTQVRSSQGRVERSREALRVVGPGQAAEPAEPAEFTGAGCGGQPMKHPCRLQFAGS